MVVEGFGLRSRFPSAAISVAKSVIDLTENTLHAFCEHRAGRTGAPGGLSRNDHMYSVGRLAAFRPLEQTVGKWEKSSPFEQLTWAEQPTLHSLRASALQSS